MKLASIIFLLMGLSGCQKSSMSASIKTNDPTVIQKMYCSEDFMADTSWKLEFTDTGAVINGCVYSLTDCFSSDTITLTQTDSFDLEKPYGIYEGFSTTSNEAIQIFISGDDRVNTNSYYKSFDGQTTVGPNQMNISCSASLREQ